ncbi:MAG: hypothetical protein K2Q07_09585 [Burkholderiaceae bacterium]|nr:hypothetical protein [Burkholderiaceae bacterium]
MNKGGQEAALFGSRTVAWPSRTEDGISRHAAFSHIEVSKALLINGMFMPKLALAALLAAGFAGFSQGLTVSVARSQEPSS